MGPSDPMNVHSISVTMVQCTNDRQAASIFGLATINGSGSFNFQIDVEDNGEPGTSESTGCKSTAMTPACRRSKEAMCRSTSRDSDPTAKGPLRRAFRLPWIKVLAPTVQVILMPNGLRMWILRPFTIRPASRLFYFESWPRTAPSGNSVL